MILAFETSCDETSAALIHHGRVLSNTVSSQISLHEEYGGVVPELAARLARRKESIAWGDQVTVGLRHLR